MHFSSKSASVDWTPSQELDVIESQWFIQRKISVPVGGFISVSSNDQLIVSYQLIVDDTIVGFSIAIKAMSRTSWRLLTLSRRRRRRGSLLTERQTSWSCWSTRTKSGGRSSTPSARRTRRDCKRMLGRGWAKSNRENVDDFCGEYNVLNFQIRMGHFRWHKCQRWAEWNDFLTKLPWEIAWTWG